MEPVPEQIQDSWICFLKYEILQITQEHIFLCAFIGLERQLIVKSTYCSTGGLGFRSYSIHTGQLTSACNSSFPSVSKPVSGLCGHAHTHIPHTNIPPLHTHTSTCTYIHMHIHLKENQLTEQGPFLSSMTIPRAFHEVTTVGRLQLVLQH